MAKKKAVISEKVKALLKAELKRFVTIVDKYLPDSKNKKDILAKFEEISELVEKEIK